EDLKRFEQMVTGSLFEELFISAPETLRHTLREQYRMHPHIMDAVNHFYPDAQGKGVLLPGGGAKQLHHQKQHNFSVRGNGDRPLLTSEQHVLWLDATMDEHGQRISEGEKRGTSRWNPFEIDLIEEFLRHLDATSAASPGLQNVKIEVGVLSFDVVQT